jgi:hypothetical protein
MDRVMIGAVLAVLAGGDFTGLTFATFAAPPAAIPTRNLDA